MSPRGATEFTVREVSQHLGHTMYSCEANGWPVVAILTIGALTTLSCSPANPMTTNVADSAGVAIVTNVGTPALLPWTLDTVRVFGGDDSGPATFHEVWPSLVDVDAQGRIFVLEPFESRVTVFDSVGRPLSTMGRRGQGPGELEWPVSVSAADDGHVYVHDGAGQLVRLALDQRTGTETPFHYSVIYAGLRHAEITPAGILVWARERYTGTNNRLDRLLFARATDTTALISGKPSYRTAAYYPRCNMTFGLHQPLAPRIKWSQWGDRVAVSVWGGFRVDVLEDNRLVRSIRWAGVGENRLSRSEAVALLEAQGYLGACDDGPAETIEKHGFHPQPQIVRALAIAPGGRLWVQVNTVEGIRILLLDPDGQIVGVLPQEFPMPVAFLPDRRPLIQVVDSVDIQRIGVAQVTAVTVVP